MVSAVLTSEWTSAALALHAVVESSDANGPGHRAVVWVQGCTLACPGCFNPETHSHGGELVDPVLLARRLIQLHGIEGLTISGGEPLQQIKPLTALLREIHARSGLSVVVFTGYRWEQLQRLPSVRLLLDCVDVLIAGPFDHSQRVAAGLIGSANKKIVFLTDRYRPADFRDIPQSEVLVTPDGDVIVTGVWPLHL